MEDQIRTLLIDNTELNKALIETKEMFEASLAEKDSIINLYENFKKQYAYKEWECEEAQKRLQES